MLSAEGNYTAAYPIAQLGVLKGEPSLIVSALERLHARKALFDGEALALRLHKDGRRAFVNWARGGVASARPGAHARYSPDPSASQSAARTSKACAAPFWSRLMMAAQSALRRRSASA